jgi:hypothetical protein
MKRPQHFLSKIVVAAVVVVSATTAGAANTARTARSEPLAALSLTVATPATATVLPAGRQGAFASIPWSKVGPGWLLSEWSAKVTSAPTLYLVDPLGGRYEITTGAATPSGGLVAWSGDGTRALFEAQTGSLARSRVTVLQLRSGRSNTFTVTGYGGRSIGFTEPDGLGIIAAGISSATQTTTPVQRFDLQGALEYTYPKSFPQSGRIEGGILYTPDGTELVLATVGGFEVVANGGQPIRYLPMYAAAGTCQPTRWWAVGVVLATCTPPNSSIALLWLVPTNGGPPTQLTVTPKSGSGDYGDLDAWSLPSGDYVQVAGACGYIYLAKLGLTRRTTPVTVPGAVGSVIVIGAYDDELALTSHFACSPGRSSLTWFNPATRVVTPLLGPPFAGSAGTAILFGQPTVLQ